MYYSLKKTTKADKIANIFIFFIERSSFPALSIFQKWYIGIR